MSYRYRRGRGSPRETAAAAMAALVLAAAAQGTGHHHHEPPPAAATASAAGGSNEALANRMAAAGYGWTGGQRQCLDWLWTRESGFQATVWNYQGSGAYGIPQALPASKMAAAGADWQTNPATQIKWGLGYIRATYATPCGAWSHEVSLSWY